MTNLPNLNNCKIAILGLGYVGLPLALQIAKTTKNKKNNDNLYRSVVGFDINNNRISELINCIDITGEFRKEVLENIQNIKYTSDIKDLVSCEIFIITVPTPIDISKKPDLSYLRKASQIVASAIKERIKINDQIKPIIIYESTVYPGVTENFCIPLIEKETGLVGNLDFYYGYSPERINPGDKVKTINDIVKLTSGSNGIAGDCIDDFYSSIIEAGTYKTKSIKIAEAAKIIENTQRDINVALINELSIIFNLMEIDTLDVLEAAKTKWNFLDFKPGLVGGHCIGVDPYYLTYKAQLLGYYPEMVLSGRRINDSFGEFVVDKLIKLLIKKKFVLPECEVLILGITFKENCSDIRNTKVITIIDNLNLFGVNVQVVDPLANQKECKENLNLNILSKIPNDKKFDVALLAVSHQYFCDLDTVTWKNIISENGTFLDIKGIIPRELNPVRL